jgi:hypothetical protein
MLSVYFSLADIPEHGLLMFILGTLVLYPQCRIELSVMRQQMLESGGKKILLGADAAEGQITEQHLAEALDKTLDTLRKVVTSRALFYCSSSAFQLYYVDMSNATEAASSDKFVTLVGWDSYSESLPTSLACRVLVLCKTLARWARCTGRFLVKPRNFSFFLTIHFFP